MTTVTPTQDAAITKLFDAVTQHYCLTQEDIAAQGGFASAQEVGQTLALIRDPDVSALYGWTVPHVRRGRPREGQVYRYLVAGISGQALDADDTDLIQEGTYSTAMLVSNMTRNLANALRLCIPGTPDPKSRKTFKYQATVLDGVSASMRMEADRVKVIIDGNLAVRPIQQAAMPTTVNGTVGP